MAYTFDNVQNASSVPSREQFQTDRWMSTPYQEAALKISMVSNPPVRVTNVEHGFVFYLWPSSHVLIRFPCLWGRMHMLISWSINWVALRSGVKFWEGWTGWCPKIRFFNLEPITLVIEKSIQVGITQSTCVILATAGFSYVTPINHQQRLCKLIKTVRRQLRALQKAITFIIFVFAIFCRWGSKKRKYFFRPAFKFDRRVLFALRRKLLQPPIARLPAI